MCFFLSSQATNLVFVIFCVAALVLTFLSLRVMMFVILVIVFTSKFRNNPIEGRLHRRCRDLWHSIPPVPVRVVESEEEKKLQEALQG